MTLRVLGFGIAREIFGAGIIQIDVEENISAGALKKFLETKFPTLKNLSSYRIAINTEFAETDDKITSEDEVAILPAVSGG
ncbi:MAG: molybdopterin synthase sulfur carrier subunit [Bacteroidetes bacterium]|nr:MAG: molybdopterin synthase sulfur carrier subunit [Bacteroidota bacterium]